MIILDTRSIDRIYESLSKLLNTSKENIKSVIDNIDIKTESYKYADEFRDYFKLDGNFYFPYVTIHHFTSRLCKDYELNFKIDNLENTLLSENSFTKFLKENNLEFKKENGRINVYYKSKLKYFDNEEITQNYLYYTGMAIKKRLYSLEDSCINGFLFNEIPKDSIYDFLLYIPEILDNILSYIGDTEIKDKYIENSVGLSATILVNIDNLTIDGCSKSDLKEYKSSMLLSYIIEYLKEFSCGTYTNPIIRLDDNKDISNNEILSIKEFRENIRKSK